MGKIVKVKSRVVNVKRIKSRERELELIDNIVSENGLPLFVGAIVMKARSGFDPEVLGFDRNGPHIPTISVFNGDYQIIKRNKVLYAAEYKYGSGFEQDETKWIPLDSFFDKEHYYFLEGKDDWSTEYTDNS